MSIEEIVNGVIATIIASLIGYLFKGRFVSMFNNFVNHRNSKVGAFFGYIFIILIIAVPVATIESLNISTSAKVTIFSFYIYALLFYFRYVVINTGETSFTFKKASIKERFFWLKRFGKLEFLCNIDGIAVGFYSAGGNIYFVPLDVNHIDMDKWTDIETKISPIVDSSESIDDIKSILKCV